MDDEDARERRRQAKYSHMAQHQEVAKLVAYAAFRGELPAVGPLLIRRPDFGLQNERAQRLADEEARWLATLRKRGEEGARAARRKPALSSSRSALDQGTAEPERRGVSGLGGGADAARERVKVRAQRSRELAVALSNAPVVATALHFRRAHPYSANHELPIAGLAPAQQRAGIRPEPPQQPAPCRVASASTVASKARLEHRHSSTAPAAPAPAPNPIRSRPMRGATARPSSPSAPACASSVYASSLAAAQGLPSAPHGLPARPATGELGRGSATSSASGAAASPGRARASSARGSAAASADGAPRWGGPRLAGDSASGAWELGGGGSNVGFGSAVPARPLERSAHWFASPSGRFWAVGEGAPPPAVDALPRAEAAARPRSDVAPKLAPPGTPKWPQQPPPAVGSHIGPGAYAGAYGGRARSPWDLRPSERLRPSATFSARELRRGAAAGAARDAMSTDATDAASAARRGKAGATLQVGADGFIATPPPLVPGSEYSGFTLAATAKRRAPSHGLYARSPPRSADEAAAARRGGGGADTGGRARVTISQRQAISLERLRTRLEQLERAGLRDPANDSVHARPASAKSRRFQRAALVRLGGATLPTGAKVTPDALTAVSSKVLDASEALG